MIGWERGLGVEDDVDRLQPDEEPRFYSGANVGCFADAGAWTTLSAPLRNCVESHWEPRGSGQLPDGCERISDESQQADLVTFTAQSGGVVRLGRNENSDVAAIVATSGMTSAKA